VSQFRKENRQDDAVVGEYSYTDPLGHVRTVKYTADKLHGFRAEIYIDGKLETPHIPQAPEHQHHTQAHHNEESGGGDDDDYESNDESDY
jgi:Insect cuticle protein